MGSLNALYCRMPQLAAFGHYLCHDWEIGRSLWALTWRAVLGLFFWLGYFNCLELKERLIPKRVEAVSLISEEFSWLRDKIFSKKKKSNPGLAKKWGIWFGNNPTKCGYGYEDMTCGVGLSKAGQGPGSGDVQGWVPARVMELRQPVPLAAGNKHPVCEGAVKFPFLHNSLV